jgi:iron complex transport system permease protein
MKVTVDIDKMLREGRISPAEHARLKSSAASDTGSLALNLLLGFGVIATAVGASVLLHSAPASVVLGIVMGAAGHSLAAQSPKSWGVLGSILLLVGSLLAAGGVLTLTHGNTSGFMLVTALFLVAGVMARSGLLIALGTLALAHTVGAGTGYGHAMYVLVIQEPTITVVLFTLLSWACYRWSLSLQPDYSRLALVSARTSLFLVNFGFWVGSLWGDTPGTGELGFGGRATQTIPDWAFAAAWAAALFGAGSWAARENRRWVVNLVAVFGAIHFYTQYFERLGASPGTILTAGLVAIGIALALFRYNRTDLSSRPPSPATSS